MKERVTPSKKKPIVGSKPTTMSATKGDFEQAIPGLTESIEQTETDSKLIAEQIKAEGPGPSMK